ncbi:MAG: DMT family transporter [Alicyclobacillaceae bacterium]|nr:DMT family transporter [Alicyclobacillaceae bacterium]
MSPPGDHRRGVDVDMVGYGYLTLAAAIWGGMYVVSKAALAMIPPFCLLWLRYAVALVLLTAVMWGRGMRWPREMRIWRWYAAIGAVGYAFSVGTQFVGTKLTSAHLGALVTATSPAFAALFARWSGERVTPKDWAALLIALLGTGLVVGGDMIRGHERAGLEFAAPSGETGKGWLGVMFLLLAAASWGAMSVLVKGAEKRVPASYAGPLPLTAGALIWGLLLATPLAVGEAALSGFPELARALVTPQGAGSVAYLGVISTAAAFFLWNAGIQKTSASRGALFLCLQPLVGGILGWAVLGEILGWSFWAGGALVLAAVWLTIRRQTAPLDTAAATPRRQYPRS